MGRIYDLSEIKAGNIIRMYNPVFKKNYYAIVKLSNRFIEASSISFGDISFKSKERKNELLKRIKKNNSWEIIVTWLNLNPTESRLMIFPQKRNNGTFVDFLFNDLIYDFHFSCLKEVLDNIESEKTKNVFEVLKKATEDVQKILQESESAVKKITNIAEINT